MKAIKYIDYAMFFCAAILPLIFVAWAAAGEAAKAAQITKLRGILDTGEFKG